MNVAWAAKLGSLRRYRIMKFAGTCCVLFALAIGLEGCGIRRLEDIMGPGPALNDPQLVVPPTAKLSLVVPPADVFAPPTAADTANEINPTPDTKSEGLTPILQAQENRNLFSSAKQWVAFSVDNGIDATNSAGTTCSGRTNGGRDLTVGQRIQLACSDGKLAMLEIRQLATNGASGVLIIDNVSQTAAISRSDIPPQ